MNSNNIQLIRGDYEGTNIILSPSPEESLRNMPTKNLAALFKEQQSQMRKVLMDRRLTLQAELSEIESALGVSSYETEDDSQGVRIDNTEALEIIKLRGSMRISEFATAFDITEQQARTKLYYMASRGLIRKVAVGIYRAATPEEIAVESSKPTVVDEDVDSVEEKEVRNYE
jgi:predicted DNA-binding transcriptional regulator